MGRTCTKQNNSTKHKVGVEKIKSPKGKAHLDLGLFAPTRTDE